MTLQVHASLCNFLQTFASFCNILFSTRGLLRRTSVIDVRRRRRAVPLLGTGTSHLSRQWASNLDSWSWSARCDIPIYTCRSSSPACRRRHVDNHRCLSDTRSRQQLDTHSNGRILPSVYCV